MICIVHRSGMSMIRIVSIWANDIEPYVEYVIKYYNGTVKSLQHKQNEYHTEYLVIESADGFGKSHIH